MSPTKKSKIKDFENSLSELESIIQQLDSDEVSLEKSLDNFKSGVSLIKKCEQALKDAQDTIDKLSTDLAEPVNK